MVESAHSPFPARRRRRLLAAVFALLFLGAVAWQVTAWCYQLGEGGFSAEAEGGVHLNAGDVYETRYPLVAGRSYRITFSVVNDGPLPVRVTGAGRTGDDGLARTFPIERVEVVHLGASGEGCCDLTGAVPLSPVELAPKEQLLILVTYRVGDIAWGPCARTWFDHVPVRYSVLGMPREQEVALGSTVGFQVPGDDCAAGWGTSVGPA